MANEFKMTLSLENCTGQESEYLLESPFLFFKDQMEALLKELRPWVGAYDSVYGVQLVDYGLSILFTSPKGLNVGMIEDLKDHKNEFQPKKTSLCILNELSLSDREDYDSLVLNCKDLSFPKHFDGHQLMAAHNHLANFYQNHKMYDIARREYQTLKIWCLLWLAVSERGGDRVSRDQLLDANQWVVCVFNKLAQCYSSEGKQTEATEHYERVVEYLAKYAHTDPTHYEELMSAWYQMAMSYDRAGKTEKAKHVVKKMRDFEVPDLEGKTGGFPVYLFPGNDVLPHLKGLYLDAYFKIKAEEFLSAEQSALSGLAEAEIAFKNKQNNSSDMFNFMLGMVGFLQDDYTKGFHRFSYSLDFRKKKYGRTHWLTGNAMLYVGICLYKSKNITKQEKRQALTLVESSYPLLQQSDDPDAKQSCAIAFSFLMNDAGEKNDLGNVITNFQKARPLYENFFGLEHLQLGRCYKQFGIYCSISTDTTLEPITLRHAISSLTTALDIYRKQSITNLKMLSDEMLDILQHLGHCYLNIKRYDLALQIFKDSLDLGNINNLWEIRLEDLEHLKKDIDKCARLLGDDDDDEEEEDDDDEDDEETEDENGKIKTKKNKNKRCCVIKDPFRQGCYLYREESEGGEVLKALLTCERPGCGTKETKHHEFKFCARCNRVVYCKKTCQVKHWKFHKKNCIKTNTTTTTTTMPTTSSLLSTDQDISSHSETNGTIKKDISITPEKGSPTNHHLDFTYHMNDITQGTKHWGFDSSNNNSPNNHNGTNHWSSDSTSNCRSRGGRGGRRKPPRGRK